MPVAVRRWLQSFRASLPPRTRRWAWRAALAIGGAYLGYVLLALVFLNTALGPWAVNRKPEKFQAQWSSGTSFWPGRVSVNGLRLHGQVLRTAWSVEAEHARGRVALWPLLRRQVRVPLIEADGVSGDVRRAATALARPAPRPGGWELRFDRIAARDIREARAMGLVLRGQGQAEVAFRKQLRGGPMEIGASRARFERATLEWAAQEGGAQAGSAQAGSTQGTSAQPLLSQATLDARFALARHTRAQAPGMQKLRLLDAALELDGRSPGLRLAIRPDQTIAVSAVPAQGRVHGRLAFARGAFSSGGALRWTMPVSGRDVHGQPMADTLDVALDVDRNLRLQARMPRREGSPLALDANLQVRGTGVPLRDYAALLPRTSGHLVGRWRFKSLRWLGATLATPDWLAFDGAGGVDADLRLADGRIADGSRIEIPEVDASVLLMGNRIHGRASAQARIAVDDDGRVRPDLALQMQQFRFSAAQGDTTPYVDGRDLRLRVEALRGVERELLRSQAGLREASRALRAHLAFDDARVPDLRAYNRYLPKAQLRFDGGTGRLSGDLSLDGDGGIGRGWLRLRADDAALHVAGLAVRGDVDVNTRLKRLQLGAHRFDIDGSEVKLRQVSFREPGGEAHSGWSARIVLDRASMDWDKPVTLDARARITMKDVGFLLSMFSRQRDYPDWVFRVVDSGQADARAHVRWKDGTLVLDRMEASNDRYTVKARLQLRDQQRNGSLYAQWRKLGVAVALAGGKRDFHMLRARQWYEAQPDLLR